MAVIDQIWDLAVVYERKIRSIIQDDNTTLYQKAVYIQDILYRYGVESSTLSAQHKILPDDTAVPSCAVYGSTDHRFFPDHKHPGMRMICPCGVTILSSDGTFGHITKDILGDDDT